MTETEFQNKINDALNQGDFSLAKKLLNQLETSKTVYKKGRLSKKEIEQIKQLSSNGESLEDISLKLKRKTEIIQKHFVQTNITEIRQKKAPGTIRFGGNQWQDSGQEAKKDKDIDKILSKNTPKTERRDAPSKVDAKCSLCGVQEKILPELANFDLERKQNYFTCRNCLNNKKTEFIK